ncbi:monovalent cation/H+ antiporter subunit E [Corynebacterium sp. S7]
MHVFKYIFWIIKEIFVAGFTTAWAAFKRNSGLAPVVIYYPLRVTSEWEMFWFSTSVTATPSTLTLGFREPEIEGNPRIMIVQSAFGADPIDTIAGFADMEERLSPRVKEIPLDPAEVYYEYPSEQITDSGKEV